MRKLVFATLVLSIFPSAAPAQEAGTAKPFLNRPRLSLGAGSLEYREKDFETAPGLESHFREPLLHAGFGWDFIFSGRHALVLELEFQGTEEGGERWDESDATVQENDLQVGRFTFGSGYLWSSWDRSLPPAQLQGTPGIFRFAAGVMAPFYRFQRFRRSNFVDTSNILPVFIDGEVDESFHLVGAEAALELEVGPRHIAAWFLRGRAGAEYVGVLNEAVEDLVGDDDSWISTSGVHGTVETGIVSQLAPNVELRLGYRFHHQAVFQERKTIDYIDPVDGPMLLSVELPDNATQMHILFLEAAFPF